MIRLNIILVAISTGTKIQAFQVFAYLVTLQRIIIVP